MYDYLIMLSFLDVGFQKKKHKSIFNNKDESMSMRLVHFAYFQEVSLSLITNWSETNTLWPLNDSQDHWAHENRI